MATYYVKSGAGATEFANATAYTSGTPGSRIVPRRADAGANNAIAKRYVWECTTSGTSAGADPTWPASVTADVTTVTSNTAVFTARKPGYSSGTTANWAFATIYLDYPNALAVVGDTVYVSHQHAENVTTTVTGMVSGVEYVCVNDASAPPTALATTATVTTTGAVNIGVGTGNSYVYGITFIGGATDTGTRTINTAGTCESCSFQIASTGASSTIGVSGFWRNCSIKFAAAGQSISSAVFNNQFAWSGGSLLSGGTSPTTLITAAQYMLVEDVDLSNASAGINLASQVGGQPLVIFRRLKLPASWSGAMLSGVPTNSSYHEMTASDNSGTNYVYRKKTSGGETFSETTVVRTGGATNGTTALSHKLVASTLANYPAVHCETPEMVEWNDTTATPVTVTVEVLHDSLTALNNNEIWLECQYLSDSASPLGLTISSAPGPVVAASATTASTATWTTTGLTNPNTRKLSVTFTPQLKGYIHAKVFLAKASTTAYVDPVLTLS